MADEPFISKTPNAKRRVVFMNAGKQSGAASSVPPADGSCEGFVLTCVGGVPTWVPPSDGGLLTTTTTISNAQLRSTSPITLVSAQGAGTVVAVRFIDIKFNYGGTNAFTTGGGLVVTYDGDFSNAVIRSSAWDYSQAEDAIGYVACSPTPILSSLAANKQVTFAVAVALGGNAANNNTVTVVVHYEVVTL